MLELRPTVAAFAQLMEAKLRANDHKGGWDACTLDWLVKRMVGEQWELQAAINYDSGNATRLAGEAADVANFAMMIADVCGALQADGGGDV